LQLVGASFAVENDWRRAEFRLNALQDPKNVPGELAQVTEQAIAEGRPATLLRAMAKMADRLGARTPVMVVYLATPVPTFIPSPTPTRPASPTRASSLPASPVPTFVLPNTPTPLPTFTPTPTPLAVFLLVAQDRVCDTGPAQIRAMVEDEESKGMPGVEVWVTWDSGADRFVTGLKPEKGVGYGDFNLQPDTTYAVSVAQSAVPIVTGLKTEPCQPSDSTQPGSTSWQLTFRPIPPTATPTVTPGPSPTPTAPPTPDTYTDESP
jgi:hypothetical protein